MPERWARSFETEKYSVNVWHDTSDPFVIRANLQYRSREDRDNTPTPQEIEIALGNAEKLLQLRSIIKELGTILWRSE